MAAYTIVQVSAPETSMIHLIAPRIRAVYALLLRWIGQRMLEHGGQCLRRTAEIFRSDTHSDATDRRAIERLDTHRVLVRNLGFDAFRREHRFHEFGFVKPVATPDGHELVVHVNTSRSHLRHLWHLRHPRHP